MRDFYARKERYRIFHGSTNSTRQYKIDRNKMVDTSSLSHVLSVDTLSRTALVEPNVPMDQLVAAVLPYGLVPPVVMEFPNITVGGGFAGTSGESSSFKHGFFDATINWFEMVLPDGEVVRASQSEYEDLFYGAAGSFGSMGVATLFELRLVEAKAYVELTYQPVLSLKGTFDLIREAVRDRRHDYIDGIMMAKERGIVMTGRLTDTVAPGVRVQTFRRAQDPWFFIHADRVTRKSTSPVKEAVPLEDYLFRYDRGAFFTGKYAFEYFMVPFNRITRWALDGFMKTKVMYHALHASGHSRQYIIQDLAIPAHRAERFVEYVDDKLALYPLWLCPLSPRAQTSMHPRSPTPGADDDEAESELGQLINVGVWGPGPNDYGKFVDVNRDLEREVRELGGMKWLYAQAFYTEDEFWSIYDRAWYDGLRRKYHGHHLASVYEKVRVDLSEVQERGNMSLQSWLKDRFWSTWPMTGLYGVLQTMVSRDYLLAK